MENKWTRVFHRVKDQGQWDTYAASLLLDQSLSKDFKNCFGTYWIVAGHHMREQIADDQTLVRLLRHILPPYVNERLDLFRGESRQRFERGCIGLAWTPSSETAAMFAAGLNAFRYGGVLLKASVQTAAIISGPNEHSNYLGESQFTVDPFLLGDMSVIESYPPVE